MNVLFLVSFASISHVILMHKNYFKIQNKGNNLHDYQILKKNRRELPDKKILTRRHSVQRMFPLLYVATANHNHNPSPNPSLQKFNQLFPGTQPTHMYFHNFHENPPQRFELSCSQTSKKINKRQWKQYRLKAVEVKGDMQWFFGC